MKRKFISIFIALVLALSLCLVTVVPVAAATITVAPSGAQYTTIQAAIDAAGSDDIILVAEGMYAQDLVIPDTKTNLELVGATGATIQGVATEPDASFPLAVPNIDILASGVKIHGFTIEGPVAVPDEYASGMLIGAPNVEIYDNDFKVTAGRDTWEGKISLAIQTYRMTSVAGVDISGLNIHDNTFTNLDIGAAGFDAIFINIDAGTGTATIADNEFTGNVARAISVERSNVVISGNSIITDLAPYTAGAGGYQGMYIGCFPVAGGEPLQTNVSIIGNTVGGGTTGEGFAQGIRVGSSTASLGFSAITVSQNTVQYNTDGIVVRAPTGASVDVVINYNNIVDNTNLGVNNATIDNAELDATSNWWGTTEAAAIALMVGGSVTYDSWLESSVDISGDTSVVTLLSGGAEPAVTTGAATLVELYSATLQGNLDDMGDAPSVDVSFVYGTTSIGTPTAEPNGGYDSQTSLVAQDMLGPFTAELTSLPADTTYYFRAKAQIGELIRYGNELSFTTDTETIGISVAPTSIDFGTMPIGQPSVAKLVKVENTGDVDVDLSATLANISSPDVYTTGLTMDLTSVALWGAPNVAPGEPSSVVSSLVLTVPLGTEPGTYTATLIFWAEASP